MSDYNLSIGIFAGGQVPFHGGMYHTHALGGSESSVVLLAEELQKRGNDVHVFAAGDEETYGKDFLIKHNDVMYYRLPEMWNVNFTLDWDIFLVQRDYGRVTDKLLRTRQLGLLNHDILVDPTTSLEHAYPLDFLYCLTNWHKSQYEQMCPELTGKISVLGNPLDVDYMLSVKESLVRSFIENGQDYKYPHPTFLWNSRPERGLLLLLKFIWPEILKLYPDANLHVCYYPTDKEKLPPQIQAIHQTCEALMSQMPRVFYFGGLSKELLYIDIIKSHAVLYPSIFPETFNISAVESQILGTPYLCTDMFAMQETVLDPKHRIFDYEVLNKLYYDNSINAPINYKFLSDKVKKLLVNCVEYHKDHPMTTTQETLSARYDKWRIAAQFETDCMERFLNRSCTKGKRIIQNLMYHSDFVAAKLACENYLDISRPDTDRELLNLYEKIYTLLDTHHENPEEYHVHASHDVAKNTDCPPRIARALEHMQAFVGDNEFTMTDIGMGEGRALYQALKTFGRQVQVQGIDFSAGMVDLTAQLIAPFFGNDLTLASACLLQGDPFGDAWNHPIEQADVVFGGEVLEHQQDVVHALNVIDSWCKPGGLIVLTLPYGPWEAISNDLQERIDHVQHFERRDLHEILADYEGRYTIELISPMHSPKDYSMCANWVVTIKKPELTIYSEDNKPCLYYYPNYQRKFETTRPYVKLGLTCITKNEEENIAGFLKPFIDKMDHIALIDTGSTDSTTDLAMKILKVGYFSEEEDRGYIGRDTITRIIWQEDFSHARNAGLRILESRDVDWVLWGDCDERITNPHLLKKYLTGDLEIFNGFILFQVQLMKDEVSTRDIPVRLFRANKGYKFSGIVHEQVYGWGRNEYVDPKIALPDIEFLHYGYVTPTMRWNKVRYRNLALMEKERQVNPNRDIGTILYTRDLLHIVTWEMDKNKPLDDKLIGYMNLVLQMLQKYIDEPSHICHPMAQMFYQQALQLLGESGVASFTGQVPIQAQIGLVGNRGPLHGNYQAPVRWFLAAGSLAAHLRRQEEMIVKQLGSVPRLFNWELEK